MKNSKTPSPNSPNTTGARAEERVPRSLTASRRHVEPNAATTTVRRQIKLLVTGWKARRVRNDPAGFAEFAFADETGRPMRLGAVHRELHTFLSDAPRGLVELPRDHGKTVQVLIRVL